MPHGNRTVKYLWRGAFTNAEIHALHAEAFETRLFDESEWNWVDQCNRYSLGWVVARNEGHFVGFANVLWDGLVHAFIEDVMVDASLRHRRVVDREFAQITCGDRRESARTREGVAPGCRKALDPPACRFRNEASVV